METLLQTADIARENRDPVMIWAWPSLPDISLKGTLDCRCQKTEHCSSSEEGFVYVFTFNFIILAWKWKRRKKP